MDIFSVFDGTPAKKRKSVSKANRPARGALPAETKLKGIVVRVTDNFLLFFDDGTGRETFLPFSKIMDWWFTSNGGKRHLRIVDLELDDDITVLIPIWLARKEKLV